MLSQQPAIKNLRVIVDSRLRSCVEIGGKRYYRSGPRYNNGYAVYPVSEYEVVDISDFDVALRCRREYGLTLEEMAEMGHAKVVSRDKFNRLDNLTSPVDFQFDHPNLLSHGFTCRYQLSNGVELLEDRSY